jgi:hypothetical protein
LKLYGFTEAPAANNRYKLIIFDTASDFHLAFNASTASPQYGALELYFNNELQFQSNSYLPLKFGSWVPISIAAYRQVNANLFPNMISMTVFYDYLPILATSQSSYPFSEFTMPKSWIGLISDITYYNYFMINAWGYMKFGDNYSNNNRYILGSFSMKSTQSLLSKIIGSKFQHLLKEYEETESNQLKFVTFGINSKHFFSFNQVFK